MKDDLVANVNVQFRCTECGGVIPDGATMWSVNIHQERFEDGGLSVLQADCYHVFCGDCAVIKAWNKVSIPDRREL